MKYLYKIGGVVLVGLVFLALAWGYASFKHQEYGAAFFSYLIAAIPVLLIIFRIKKGRNKQQKEFEKWKENLKSNGTAIGVNFSNCVVEELKQTVNYTRRDVPDTTLDTRLYRPDTLDEPPGIPNNSFSRDGSKTVESQIFPDIMNQEHSYDHCVCTIQYSAMLLGEKITFVSQPILMDKVSLDVQLALERKGIIYVNPDNLEEYYWDVEFLFM